MFFYNQLTELVYSQFLIIALFEIVVIAVAIFIFKRKLSLEKMVYAIVLAFVLSLLSSFFARGTFGGMAYHERFGWPFQYYTVSRGFMGNEPNVPVPGSFHFDFVKFISNCFYWGFPAVLFFWSIKKSKNKYSMALILGSLAIFVILTVSFSYSNFQTERISLKLENSMTIIETKEANILKNRNIEEIKQNLE